MTTQLQWPYQFDCFATGTLIYELELANADDMGAFLEHEIAEQKARHLEDLAPWVEAGYQFQRAKLLTDDHPTGAKHLRYISRLFFGPLREDGTQ